MFEKTPEEAGYWRGLRADQAADGSEIEPQLGGYTMDQESREAVAAEVVNSAYRLLTTLGYDRTQISRLFEATNDLEKPSSGEQGRPLAPAGVTAAVSLHRLADEEDDEAEDDDDFELGAFELDWKFRETTLSKKLERLAKRLHAVEDFSVGTAIEKALQALREAVPLASEAHAWFLAEAAACGLRVEEDHDAWLDAASDDELEAEDQIFFLDRCSLSRAIPWWTVHRLAEVLARKEREAELIELLALAKVGKCSAKLIKRLEDAKAALEALRGLNAALPRLLPEERFLSELQRELEALPSVPEGRLISGWLGELERSGRIKRYKKSNRWAIAPI